MPKFFLSVLFLVAAFALQFFFASIGYSFDLAFAVLVACAFMLSWRELLPLTALAVLIVNWQPSFSWIIALYILFPFLIYGIQSIFSLEPWVAVSCFIAIGTLLLMFASGVSLGAIGIATIVTDMLVSAAFGSLAYGALREISST